MIHTKELLEQKYSKPDPWGYRDRSDDQARRMEIISACLMFMPAFSSLYDRAIDIGCGEGWITGFLPAKETHGIEISDLAASRFPDNVQRVSGPQGKYELVVATGVLYDHYNYDQIVRWIEEASAAIIVTCNIEKHERPISIGKQVHHKRFSYYAGNQILRVFACS